MPYGQRRRATSDPRDIQLPAEASRGRGNKYGHNKDKTEKPLSSLQRVMEGYRGFKKLAERSAEEK